MDRRPSWVYPNLFLWLCHLSLTAPWGSRVVSYSCGRIGAVPTHKTPGVTWWGHRAGRTLQLGCSLTAGKWPRSDGCWSTSSPGRPRQLWTLSSSSRSSPPLLSLSLAQLFCASGHRGIRGCRRAGCRWGSSGWGTEVRRGKQPSLWTSTWPARHQLSTIYKTCFHFVIMGYCV